MIFGRSKLSLRQFTTITVDKTVESQNCKRHHTNCQLTLTCSAAKIGLMVDRPKKPVSADVFGQEAGKGNPAELVLSRQQVRDCDRVAIERFAINGLVLMENAGRGAGEVIVSLLKGAGQSRVCIVAGIGNNAGDGFVVARHLTNVGVDVDVVICGLRDKIKGDALANLVIIEQMAVAIAYIEQQRPNEIIQSIKAHLEGRGLIVDAMLGTGVSGAPREPIRSAIQAILDNRSGKIVVALDIPSGLDCDTGEPMGPTIRADHTVTFAAMKKGFSSLSAAQYTGTVTVASIGINTSLLL